MMGQTNRAMGPRKLINPRPLENQMAISLSLYSRDKVLTMAIKRLKVRMVGRWPSTVYPITINTSVGLTLPRVACPSVRIRIMVMTMVDRATSEAPKLRDSSLRMEEWNNIGFKENTNYEL
jgi:hypothetical protein